MLKTMWSWLGVKNGAPAGANDYSPVRLAGQPGFEMLEPRLLLSADLSDSSSLLSLPTPGGKDAVVVDLDQEDPPVQEMQTPLVSLEIGQPAAAPESSGQVEGIIGSVSNTESVSPSMEDESGPEALMNLGDRMVPADSQDDDPLDFPLTGPASPPMVRVAYVVPSDRTAQADAVTNLRYAMEVQQDWYREQMERNGFGAKTFLFETEADGATPLIHTVEVSETDDYLRGDIWSRVWQAAINAGVPLWTPGQVWLLVPEIHLEYPDGEIEGGVALGAGSGSGIGPGVAMIGSNGLVFMNAQDMVDDTPYNGQIIPEIGPYPLVQDVSFAWFEGSTLSSVASTYVGAALHEMSHGFGMPHDFRNDANFHGNLMGNGLRGIRGEIYPDLYPADDTWLSPGQALALSTSRYFNPGEQALETNVPSLSIATAGTVIPVEGQLNISFSASDDSGLASALLLRNGQQIAEMPLTGLAATRTFSTPYYDAGQTDTFAIAAYDIYGNRRQAQVSITPAPGFNGAPKPFIKLDSSWLRAGQTVLLDASRSTDPDDSVSLVLVEWDLNGDGLFDTAPTTTKTLALSFSQSGTRLISARLTDPHGAQAVSAPIPVRVLAAAAEITVLGNGLSIADGDTTPSTADHTDFGSATQGGPSVYRTFTVRNDGPVALTLGSVIAPAGFMLAEGLSTSLAPGASDTFTVQLDTATAGTKTGDISFSTNASDENPFNFTITGVVTAPTAPEITVLGSGYMIANGDTTPSATDWTDFGNVVQGSAAILHAFTVRNDGTASLTLGAVMVPAGFSLTEGLSTSLAPGASDTFTVRLETAVLGTKTGDVVFSNNDSDENPFNFRITGIVSGVATNLALGKTAVASTSYGGYPAANATDGSPASRWSSQFSDNEWIYVDLGSTYTVHRVVLRWEAAYGRGYRLQVSDDASIWSDVYSTTTGDGGVDDIMLGAPASGRYVRMLGTQRATVYGYSLWEFEVYGGGEGDPVVTVAPAPAAVAEDGATNLVYTFTRSLADSSPLAVSFSVGGTAAFTTDYTQAGAGSFNATSGTVTIAASQTTAQVTVDPTADAVVEPDETVILTVTGGTGYTVGAPFVATGTIQNDDGELVNLALGRPASASTSYSGLPPVNATDGNTASRWSSLFSDNEWIHVDLGSVYTISRVVLRWETAYGRGYKLQVSSNGSTWSDVYSTTTGDGGVDDISLSSSGRYVRMLGTQRGTMYGYSLWELEVYGGTPTNHAPAVSSFSKSGTQDTPLPFAAVDFAAAFTDPDAGDSLQKIKITSLPGHGELTFASAAVSVDQEITTAELGALVYTPTSGYTGSDSFQWNGSDGSLYAATEAAVNLSINPGGGNLALGKTAVSSTNYTGLPPSNVTDGNVNSRWSSQFSDNEWIYVDLGSTYTMNRVVLQWETAYGRGYKIQVSGNASTWSDVYSTTTGDGGVDDIALPAPASGRYVRMLGTERGTVYGYSLYELEVYGGGPPANLALHKSATASTSYPGLPASNVTDGGTGTRWSSQFSDNEWIYVDLGTVYTIQQVILRWEAAYGRGYAIQVSNDASIWSDVYSTTAGDGGIDDIALATPVSCRYVRLLGTQRATIYGYSLWEFEVYG